jgi:hypothetical protein
MKTPLHSRLRTGFALFAGSATLVLHLHGHADPAAVPAGYAAHEWGTFTSIQGSDGTPIPWNPLDGPSDLPGFVFHRNLPTRNPGPAGARIRDTLILGAKASQPWLQRMETPVIYFHAREPLSVDVRVRFPQGLITEWFPQVSGFGPVASIDPSLPPSRESHIHWSAVRVVPPTPTNPADSPATIDDLPTEPGSASSHYFTARQASSHRVETTRPFLPEPSPQHDRFLFYRGAGQFPAPLHLSVPPDDRSLRLANQGPEPIGPLFVVRVHNHRTAYQTLATLPPAGHAVVPIPEPATASGDGLLDASLQTALVTAGLTPAEATAMVDTWRDAWLGEDGTRVLYLLPRAWTDRTLPLELTPPPASLVRVMVGRADVLLRSQESRIASLLQAHLDGNTHWAVASLKALGLGRFLDAGVTRSARLLRENHLRLALSCQHQPEPAILNPDLLSEPVMQRRVDELLNALRQDTLAAR